MNPLRYRKSILAIYSVLLIISIYFILQLKVYYFFENFFPKNDADFIAYKEFRESFSVDDRLLTLALRGDKGIFNPEFLERVAELEINIAEHNLIEHSSSIRSLKVPIKTPLGWVNTPLLSKNPEKIPQDSVSIFSNLRLKSFYISADNQFYAIHFEIADSTTDRENRQVIQFVEEQTKAAGFTEYHMAGFLNTQVNYIVLLEKEIPLTSGLVALGLALILMLLYRSPGNALLLTINVFVGLIIFFGYLGLVGRTLNITSTLFTTIMIIVGISDIIHLQTYYHKYLVQKVPPLEAIKKALSDVRMNLLLTSVTTAAGFFTFLTSSIPHISTFGFDAGIGVLMAFIVSITLAPVLFFYFPPSESFLSRLKVQKKWDRLLYNIYRFGKKYKSGIAVFAVALVLLSLGGTTLIDTNQTLTGNFSDSQKIKKDIDFFETQFGGIRGFELIIKPLAPYTFNDLEVLRVTDKIESYLQQTGETGPVFSPASWAKTMNQMNSGGRVTSYVIPEDQEYFDYLLLNDKTRNKSNFINEEKNLGRLVTRMKDIGRLEAAEFKETFLDWYRNEGLDKIVHIDVTGSAVLIDGNNESVMKEMFMSLGIAFLFISILMALLFKKPKMVLVSILPNIIPLLAVAGLMGISGIPLNAATSLTFTIGFVIAIDDTIHFLTRFKTEYLNEKSLEMSIKNTLAYTGKAVIQTTMILFTGYIMIMFSSFKEISHHSFLVTATLLCALLADLYLMPVLLRFAGKRKDVF